MTADIDAPDKVVYGLSFRQLAILAIAAVAMYGLWKAVGDMLPGPVLLAAAALAAGLALGLAVGRRDGLPLDRWLGHALSFRRTPKTLSPHQPGQLPDWVQAPAVRVAIPAPLRLPADAIAEDGTITVGGGAAAIVAATGINLGLRTSAEQHAALDTFGRWLNSLTTPTQIVVSAQPVDLATAAEHLATQAEQLAADALRDAAADHAAFLAKLADKHDPLRRQILLVSTSSDPHAAKRLAEDTARALSGLGVTTKALDGAAATSAIAAAADPYRPPRMAGIAAPQTVITTHTRTVKDRRRKQPR